MIRRQTTLLTTLAAVGAVATLAEGSHAHHPIGMSQPEATGDEAMRMREAAGRGAKGWAANCASCHNFRSLLEKSDDQWRIAATHMRVRANLPGDLVDDIIFFLQASNEAPEGHEHGGMGGHQHGGMGAEPEGHEHGGTGEAAGHEHGEMGAEPQGHEHGEMGAEAEHHVTGNAERGALVFNETCVACHGANGRGAIENVPNLAERLREEPDEHLLESIEQGIHTRGSSIPMPPKGGNPGLNEQDMADVLAYLRAHFSR